jgi:dUTP pyrophosphatase
VVYGTGLALEIPEGYVGLIFPRSSISKTSLSLANCVGVIDSGYRGEILLKFRTDANNKTGHYTIGDRIGQLLIIPYPQIEFEEVLELSDTIRSGGGFGSSGQ